MSAVTLRFPSPGKTTWWSLAVALAGLAAVAASVATAFQPQWVHAATGLWALCIMLLPPAFLRPYDWFSSWTFVMLSVVIGVTLRGFYITLQFPDATTIDQLYLLGQDSRFFLQPSLILLLGLLALCGGYLGLHPRKRLQVVSQNRRIPRLYLICLFVLAISAYATFRYIQLTGGFESSLLSAKRTVIPELNLEGANYQSYGELRFLASLAIFAHLLVVADCLRPGSRQIGWKAVLAAALLVVACLLPFYASIRSNVAIYLCLSLGMFYYSGRRMPKPLILGGAALAILAVYAMTVLRAERNDAEAFSQLRLSTEVFDSLILNRNQIELAKTAHIVHAIPDPLHYQYGATIARWAAAPVPRRLWPDKPVIHPGPQIGNEVYDQRVAGVPPGIVAELYWNFGPVGMIIGCTVFGMGLRWVYERFRPARGGDPFQAALYVVGPMLLGYEAVGSSVGSGIFRTLIYLIPMFFLLWIIRGTRTEPLPQS